MCGGGGAKTQGTSLREGIEVWWMRLIQPPFIYSPFCLDLLPAVAAAAAAVPSYRSTAGKRRDPSERNLVRGSFSLESEKTVREFCAASSSFFSVFPTSFFNQGLFFILPFLPFSFPFGYTHLGALAFAFIPLLSISLSLCVSFCCSWFTHAQRLKRLDCSRLAYGERFKQACIFQCDSNRRKRKWEREIKEMIPPHIQTLG